MSVVAQPTEAEICHELSALVPGRPIADLRVSEHAYRTSHWLAELEVLFRDGGVERLVLKDLSEGSLTDEARRAKPACTIDPAREIEVYRDVLHDAGLGTAAFRGGVIRPTDDRYWLFLEHLEGVELWQVGSLEVWCIVANRLAELHAALAGAALGRPPLWSREYGSAWLERAQEASGHEVLFHLAPRFGEIVDRLLRLPRGLVHGELFPSNVIVDVERERVSPIDWETAAVGPQLLDLAALTAGRWTEGERRTIALAYAEASGRWADVEQFLSDLDACRLHLAVQWLARSASWTPPAEHAHDWLGEVETLARRLNLL